MIFRNLDSNGDWTLGKGKNNYLRDNAAIGLNIKTRINSWKNDCFFALNDGIDWYNRLGTKNQRRLLEEDLKLIIKQSEGVTSMTSFSTQLIGRDFRADYSVLTVFSREYIDNISLSV